MDIAKILDAVRRLGVGKIVITFLLLVTLVLAYNAPVIVPAIERLIGSHSSRDKKFEYVISDKTYHNTISNLVPDPDIIKGMIDSRLSEFDDHVMYAAVYKFIPGSEPYMYQGSILLSISTSKDETYEDLIKAASTYNVRWIPINSLKVLNSPILNNEYVILNVEEILNTLRTGNDFEVQYMLSSVNLGLMYDGGTRYLVAVPIRSDQEVVGSIVLAVSEVPDPASLTKYVNRMYRISSSISKYVGGGY